MGYRLHPEQPIAHEVVRIANRQLELAIAGLNTGNDAERDNAVLEELDGVLGDCHNCGILCDVLTSDATLNRTDAARCLRLVRRYERELRRRAHRLGTTVHEETPKQFIARVRRLWRSARYSRRPRRRGTSWRSAA